MISEELEVEETQIDQSFLDCNRDYIGYRSNVWRQIGAEASTKHACQLTALSTDARESQFSVPVSNDNRAIDNAHNNNTAAVEKRTTLNS